MFKNSAARLPGLKAKPAVQPLSTMTNRTLRNFEITLGALQITALIGIVGGTLIASYMLGFTAGESSVVEATLNKRTSVAAKIPIRSESIKEEEVKEIGSELYAKLGDNATEIIDKQPVLDKIPAQDLSDTSLQLEKSDDSDITTDTKSAIAQKKEQNIDILANNKPIDNSAKKADLLQMDDVFKKESSNTEDKGIVRVLGGDPIGKKQDTARTLGEMISQRSQPQAETVKEPLLKVKEETTDRIVATDSAITTSSKSAPLESEQKIVVKNTLKNEPPANTAKFRTITPLSEDKVKTTKSASSTSVATAAWNEPPKPKKVIPKGWYAQVAAHNSNKEAEILALKLRGSGFPVVIEQASVKGQDYFRVLVGPEDTKDRGAILMNQVKRETKLKTEPFLKSIK